MASTRLMITAGVVGIVVIVGIAGGIFVLSSTTSTHNNRDTTSTRINPNTTSNTSLPATSSTTLQCEFSETVTPINLRAQVLAFTLDTRNNNLFGIGYNGTFQNLYEFNPADNSVISVLNLTSASSGIVYDSLTNTFYIASSGLNPAIIVINASDYSTIKNISPSAPPSGLAFDPDNGEIYVASYRSNMVSVINGSTNSLISEISTSLSPSGFAYVSQSKEMYVTTLSVNTSRSEVDVINTTTNSVISQIPLAIIGSSSITYDQANDEIYVASFASNNITIINPRSNQIVKSVLAPYSPDIISYNPTDLNVYVATNQTGGAISTIDSGTDTVQTHVSGLGYNPPGAFSYDSANSVMYLTFPTNNIVLAIAASQRSLSCLSQIKPTYSLSISDPYLISSSSNHTFVLSYNLTSSQSATVYYNGTLSYLTQFSGNPQWEKLANGSWIPTNSSALSGATTTPLWKIPQNELAVTMQLAQISANQTGSFVFDLNVGSALQSSYYGLVLNAYIEFSSYPGTMIAIANTGYIPIEVVSPA